MFLEADTTIFLAIFLLVFAIAAAILIYTGRKDGTGIL